MNRRRDHNCGWSGWLFNGSGRRRNNHGRSRWLNYRRCNHGSLFCCRSSRFGNNNSDPLWHYTLELAVIRPEQIIKRLFRGLSNTDVLPEDSSDGFYVDTGAFSSDASSSDGGGDSFG